MELYESRVLVRGEALALLLGRRAFDGGGGARGLWGARGLRDGVGAAQRVVRGSRSVSVADEFADGEAAPEVVCGERGVRLFEREQAVDSLCLARDGDVGRRVGNFRRNFFQKRRAPFRLAVQQSRLGEQEIRLAD